MSSLSAPRIIDFVKHLDSVLPNENLELVVVTPAHVPKLARTVVVPEPIRLGNIGASSLAYDFSSGDILVGMSDDHLIINPEVFMSIRRLINQGEKTYFPFCLGLPLQDNKFGTVYGYYYANFPAMSRRSAEKIGGWFDPQFKGSWSDCDMSLRVWNSGGRVNVIEEQVLSIDNAPSTFGESRHSFADPQLDDDLFVARWHGIYGNGFRYRSIFGNFAPQKINAHYPNDWLDGNSFSRNIPSWRVYLMRVMLSRDNLWYVIRLMIKWINNKLIRTLVKFSTPSFRAVVKKMLRVSSEPYQLTR